MTTKRVLMMAGGTGGHVFPALATAQALQQRGFAVEWLGSPRGIENELIPSAGLKLHTIAVAGLRGKGTLSLLAAPFNLLRAIWQANRVLRRVKPDLVVGMGGFASGPGGVAARLRRLPLLIHEQNAIPGMTNRVLATMATRVLQAFPSAFPSKIGAYSTGNPVRSNIRASESPAARYAARTGPIRLLVVGGSLGAQAINEAVPNALALLPSAERPEIWHQSGKRNLTATEAAYQKAGVEGRIVPFIDNMDAAYAWADWVLCRAGALTVSELSLAGVASVLVPYPHAVDDHQTANAGYLTNCGAAHLLPQNELTAERLAAMIQSMNQRQILIEMAERALEAGVPDATERVADHCQECCR